MKITLTLDDDIVARLQIESRRTGRPFEAVVNDYLQAGLVQRRPVKAVAPLRIESVRMGTPLRARAYDRIGALLDEIKNPEQVPRRSTTGIAGNGCAG